MGEGENEVLAYSNTYWMWADCKAHLMLTALIYSSVH